MINLDREIGRENRNEKRGEETEIKRTKKIWREK